MLNNETLKNHNENNSALNALSLERRGEIFNYYFELFGLRDECDTVILPSMQHYFYASEEMKNVKNIINLKELNRISEIRSFFHLISNLLPKKSNFIGCFVDNKKQNGFAYRSYYNDLNYMKDSEAIENGIISKIYFLNIMYALIDFRTNRFLSSLSVTQLLEEYGFKVLDMTELNGLTFFCAQRLHKDDN